MRTGFRADRSRCAAWHAFLCVAMAAYGAAAQVNPFGPQKDKAPEDAVPGVIQMSDGSRCEGMVYLTPGRRLRLFDAKNQEYVDYSFKQLKELDVLVKEARIEKEWRFKEMGSDEKVYTGKAYARKDFLARIVLKDGQKRELEIARGMPVYCMMKDGKRKTILLQPYLRGDIGSTLNDLVHPTSIVFKTEEVKAGTKPVERPETAPGGGKAPQETKATAGPEKIAAEKGAPAKPAAGGKAE